jgi:hypothetical protein
VHILDIAATDPGLAGAIAQCPLVDGVGEPPKYLPLSIAPDSIATHHAR